MFRRRRLTTKEFVIFIGFMLCLFFCVSIFSKCNDTTEEKRIHDQYVRAIELIEQGDYNKGCAILESLGNYQDSKELIKDTKYQWAKDCFENGDIISSYWLFYNINPYKDAHSYLNSMCENDPLIDLKARLTKTGVVRFGEYYSSQNVISEIEWVQVKRVDNKVLLTTKMAIDAMPFNDTYERVTWQTSSLRYWLNNDFYSSVFNEYEQKIIADTYNCSTNHPSETQNGYSDKVFLIKGSDVSKFFEVKSEWAISDYKSFKNHCVGSEYALSKGLDQEPIWKFVAWWTSSTGDLDGYAQFVDFDMSVDTFGSSVTDDRVGVRPFIWIDLDKLGILLDDYN